MAQPTKVDAAITVNDGAIADALADDGANHANRANKAKPKKGPLWPIFVFAALWVAPLAAAVAFIGTGAANTEGIGSVFALYYEGSTVGDRSAGVSTSGAVSLCTLECWKECRKYKKGRRCETHCNSPFGDKDPRGNCTIVEAGVAGCVDDFLSTTQTVRGYGLGFFFCPFMILLV